MPCSDRGMEEYMLNEKAKKNKELNEMLCSVCRILEQKQFDFGVNPQLDTWWNKPKKENEHVI